MCCGRPDALLAAFQDAKSFSTFIGLAGLFIYQSKVRVGFIAWFLKTGEISDQVQPKVSHHRVPLLALRKGQTVVTFFLASLCLLPEPGLQSQSLPCFTHSLPSTGCLSSSIKTAGNLDDSSEYAGYVFAQGSVTSLTR